MKASFTMVALAARIANVQAVQPNLEFTTDVKPEADVDQMCFTVFTNDGLSGFYYTFSGPWGSSNGHAGTSGSICVPTNNTAGGAAYLGTESNPGPGSTKLECFFPTTGEANCDISLVDGYSLSAGCVANNTEQIIGGYEDLNGNGIPCPDQQGPNCINTEGYAASQSDVGPFFQQAVNNDNDYKLQSVLLLPHRRRDHLHHRPLDEPPCSWRG